MNCTEKAAYLKGLCEGLNPDAETPEGRLIRELIETVTVMAEKIDRLETETTNLHEYIEEVDEDLSMLEDAYYGDFEDEDEDGEDEDEEIDIDDYFHIKCPTCGETICFDETVDINDLECPACGETIQCEIECDGDCEGCGICDEETEIIDEETE